MKARFSRESYIPKGALPIDPDGTDAAIYTYENGEKPLAIAFVGKAAKPTWHYQFPNEEMREGRIKALIEGRKAHAEAKAKAKAERNKPHSLKIGDILDCSWGYDQTNIDFYEVVKVVGKNTVEIRKVSSVCTKSEPPCDYVVPNKGCYIGDPMRKRVNAAHNSVTMNSYSCAMPWSGKPMYETSFGYGH